MAIPARAEGTESPRDASWLPVRFERRGGPREVRVPAGTPLIEAVRRAELPIASACGAEGACGRCALRIVAGEAAVPAETSRERAIRDRNRVGEGMRLACRVPVTGPLVVAASYW